MTARFVARSAYDKTQLLTLRFSAQTQERIRISKWECTVRIKHDGLSDARGRRSLQVARLVPNQNRIRQGQIEEFFCRENHSRPRLSTLAIHLPLANACRRMMGTIEGGQQRRAPRCELLVHPSRVIAEGRLGIVTARYASLIGNDDAQKPSFLCFSAEVKNTGNPLGLIRRMHITMVDVDDAVPVEEQRFARPRHIFDKVAAQNSSRSWAGSASTHECWNKVCARS